MISWPLTSKAQATKTEIGRWDCIILKSKWNSQQNEKATNGIRESFRTMYQLCKGLFSKIYKELLQFNSKTCKTKTPKSNNMIKNSAKDLTRHFSKEYFTLTKGRQVYEKMLKFTIHQGNANQTTVRYLTAVGKTIIKNQKTTILARMWRNWNFSILLVRI